MKSAVRVSVVVYHNARVHADGGPAPTADAMAVGMGRLLAVGRTARLLAEFPGAARVDLRGLTVFPGFIDAHIHCVGYGLSLLEIDLRKTRSIAEAVQTIAGAAAMRPEGTWLVGHGWDKNVWAEGRFPTRHDLDPVTDGRPAALASKDGHLLWVNTAALRAAGVTRYTPDPPGGTIGRETSGEPDGLLKEQATALVRLAAPAPSAEMREQATLSAAAALNCLGITGIHNFTGTTEHTPANFATFQRLRARDALTVRIVACVPDTHLEAAAAAGMQTGLGDAMLRIGPVKIFADGTLGSQTASMLEPFEGQPGNYGIQVRTPEEIDRLVRQALEAGLWAAVHAIGDRANRDVLDVFERHHEASRRAGCRHRIEHVQVLHPDDLPRLARLGVTASMQPVHATADRDIADRYWGCRARLAYAFRSLAATRVNLAFGSDAPVETPDPWRGLYAAVARKREDEPDRPAWHPEERLSLHEAIQAYTLGAARAAGTETWQGSLEEGKVADFIVLDRDPYVGPPEELLRVDVLATVLGGRVVHAAGELAELAGSPDKGAYA
ncbi:MAG: amidohydrolase [Armatimonadota bacterium]|nr:amidohydrolase [Armatimonadota bacterium]